ncbi:ubiquitin-protein ligase molybdopterin-converting factor [Coprinopsis sp. MPI-PUGE-AT-0042]|nr:ubiquitin-protein ligase molybdopterin-converting factor [Coprinopsis sp. MPI-PUGE-AT-0042]
MSSSIGLQSHKTQLIATAVAASLSTAGILYSYQQLTKKKKRRALDGEIKRSLALADSNGSSSANSSSYLPLPKSLLSTVVGDDDEPDIYIQDSTSGFPSPPAEDMLKLKQIQQGRRVQYNEELIREHLARNYAFFGDEGMAKVRGGSVVIVGCGGVGSWAAVMLARSGVSKIRLVDFDQVTLSSLNRHATAGMEDVGIPKVACVAKTLKSIANFVDVEPCVDIWRKEEGGKLLEGYDWVVDAIDNIQTKVDLLKYCYDNGIKVFSSMGAGAKSDPTRIQISDISYTIYDPLARSVRRRLRLLGVPSGIPVVYSTEVPGDVKLLPLPEEEFKKGNVQELSAILPVLGPLPAIFGLNIASYIVCELAGKPISNPLPIKNRKKLYERIYRDLLHREGQVAGAQLNRLPIDEDDVGFIFEDLHRGRSVMPPFDVPTRPTLVRWDYFKPLTIDNCIVLEFRDAETHYKQCFSEGKGPGDVWGDEMRAVVERRAAEAREVRKAVM